MPEFWFYQLERSDLERALPPLLEKCLQRGWRAIVRGVHAERLDALDASLWTYKEESFLPHGLDAGDDAARQPVLLTAGLDNRNGARAIFLIDGAPVSDVSGFDRVCLIFDGRDEGALEMARSRWKEAKAAGMVASYWRESAGGGWERQS